MKRMLLLAVVVLAVAGCEGDQGPVGPSGNANVVTGTITPTNAEWAWMAHYSLEISAGLRMSYFTRYVDIPVAEITSEVLATGAILVSFEADPGSGSWVPLPFQYSGTSYDYLVNIVHEVSEGTIRLHYFNMPTSSDATLPDLETLSIPTYTFKYTVIEGTDLQAMTEDGIDISDYGRVVEYLAAR